MMQNSTGPVESWATRSTFNQMPRDTNAADLVCLLIMKHVPKRTTDDALIQEFLKNGGKVSVGKTKPLPSELGLSNNTWNNKLTKEEKAALGRK